MRPNPAVRWGAGMLLLLWLAYPIVFYAWYLTADRVTATMKPCATIGIACRSVGTWTMADGTPGSGGVIGGEPGSTVTVRATRSWALVDNPFGSWPAILANMSVLADAGGVVLILRARRRARNG